MTAWSALQLDEPLLRAVEAEGYAAPTPIQVDAIPHVLAGRDLMGGAQTGTGKTAAFALPMLQRLSAAGSERRQNRTPEVLRPNRPRALVLTPTRELAIQVDHSFRTYGRFLRLATAVVFGGVGQGPQVAAVGRGVDVLTATPGRLLDLMGQGHIHLDALEIFVLDEADRMLDMGFLPDVKRVLARLPKVRQSLFFSATLPPAIVKLAATILTNPVHVAVAPPSATADGVTQKVALLPRGEKLDLLARLLDDPRVVRALVFTRTKHGANKVCKKLQQLGIEALPIHGNKSQTARQKALEQFRSGETPVLVATDLASRGLDVEGVSHVINYDVPVEAESYVHRIGRTARAGASGTALTFVEPDQLGELREIEKWIGRRIEVAIDRHPRRGG